ncbi:hypothetical protein [Xenorhabdus siamensis]|uniref:hypothetical protein n=1 Tax=Xenorhabdus siamensis TaxID=3136254 RepID=UPI0030F4648A
MKTVLKGVQVVLATGVMLNKVLVRLKCYLLFERQTRPVSSDQSHHYVTFVT